MDEEPDAIWHLRRVMDYLTPTGSVGTADLAVLNPLFEILNDRTRYRLLVNRRDGERVYDVVAVLDSFADFNGATAHLPLYRWKVRKLWERLEELDKILGPRPQGEWLSTACAVFAHHDDQALPRTNTRKRMSKADSEDPHFTIELPLDGGYVRQIDAEEVADMLQGYWSRLLHLQDRLNEPTR